MFYEPLIRIDKARYVASLTSNKPELIEFHKNFEKSLKEGFMKSRKWLLPSALFLYSVIP